MDYNDKVISLLKEKYEWNQILSHDRYSLFSFGREKDKNYIILKDGICEANELSDVANFVDGLAGKKFVYATFVFVACVNSDFKKEEYTLFNGASFLHTISYNLVTAQYRYDNDFHYLGSKKIKKLFVDLEEISV